MKRFKKILPRFDERDKNEAAVLLLKYIIHHPEELEELDEEIDPNLLQPEPVICSGSGRFCVWNARHRTWEHPLCPGCPRCEHRYRPFN